MVKDAIGRRWQLGTIQVDYNLPERFKLEYTDDDNTKKTPVMIHRAPFGSLERFTAVLIEHTSGHFPLWLTPDQVAILLSARSSTTMQLSFLSISIQLECAQLLMTAMRKSDVRYATTR